MQELELNKNRVRLTTRERPRFRGMSRVRIRVRVGVLMEVIFLLVEVGVSQICPYELANILSCNAVEVYHAPQSFCLKDDALENMSHMSVTLDTSHLEMSPLNADALTNMLHMLVALDTSQLDMSPVNLFAPGTKS